MTTETTIKQDTKKNIHGHRAISLADENQLYYDGDTMTYWSGVIPKDEGQKKDFVEWLERVFHSYNITKEGVKHYVSALVGQDFTYEV